MFNLCATGLNVNFRFSLFYVLEHVSGSFLKHVPFFSLALSLQ